MYRHAQYDYVMRVYHTGNVHTDIPHNDMTVYIYIITVSVYVRSYYCILKF
jgi:hypothetical protein